MSKVSEAIRELQKAINEEGVNPGTGLPLDLFESNVSLLPRVATKDAIENAGLFPGELKVLLCTGNRKKKMR